MLVLVNLRKLCGLRCVQFVHPSKNQMKLMCTIKGITLEYEKDPEPLFTDAETQKLLKSMTQLQFSKVFRQRTVADNTPTTKFMTTEELEQAFRASFKKAERLLEMPPLVKIKEDEQRIISKDPALKDFSDSKFVISDVTYGLRQSERKVVIRQIDGTLEYAPMDVVKRINQIYAPMTGRSLQTPKMFEDVHLKRCLDEHKYEFVLDRLLMQYEPYEKEFHRISSTVYQHINENKDFDALRSTRHFGPMAFFLAWHKSIDDLLYDMIQRDYLYNGVELIALLYKMHDISIDYRETLKRIENCRPKRDPALEELRKALKTDQSNIQEEITTAIGKRSEDFQVDEICIKFIDQYIREHAQKKVQLELALQTLKECNEEKKQLFEGLSKAHGVQ
ncbi:28S ribosomal protein S22, mitochondrial [Teleopsis dalmanni]|uniref:28S ribosomal protein S22, mitochondrial n=1 Tax=Teleopsis dalmanni TaxID=139649 RepID=UPI0018CCAC5D|nr:28S ribosomal protein S22, mitochondrial [Teleopsis dalmanni]